MVIFSSRKVFIDVTGLILALHLITLRAVIAAVEEVLTVVDGAVGDVVVASVMRTFTNCRLT